MNTFKRKALLCAALFGTLALAGCGTDQAFLKAQADAAIADGNARVAEAQARTEEAKAAQAIALRADQNGANAYLMFRGVKEIFEKVALTGGGQRQTVAIKQPKDWLDYLEQGERIVGGLLRDATPLATVLENGRSTRASYTRDVAVTQAQQAGETARIQSVGQIAQSVATGRPNTTINVGRDATLGGGNQSNDNSTVDRHDQHNCAGGTAASGGGGGVGGAGAGATPAGSGGSGAAGGASTGGTC